MIVESYVDIITKKVLNETSGELEVKDFKQMKTRKQIKGGFAMYYISYEEAIENILSSKLDWTIILEIKNQFTYARVECPISAIEISKRLGCSTQKVTKIITLMIEQKLLMRVRKGLYRLNPFMIIPFRADGELLQKEWNQLNAAKKVNNDDNR
jgi:hypothetical protein